MSFWDEVEHIISIKRPKQLTCAQIDNNTDSEKTSMTKTSIKDDYTTHDSPDGQIDVDVVLITAVEDEYIAARKVFRNAFAEYFNSGFKYCLVNYEISQGNAIVIAIFRQTNMGLVSASMTATYAVNRFNPKLLLMCGVCAGVDGKSNFGDLIVFSPVYDYGSGKYNSGRFFPDYRQRQISSSVSPIIEEMRCDINLKRTIKDTWETKIGKPETELDIHIYPAGSGSAVITDTAVIDEIKAHQRTLGAIDMEAFAIAEVASAALTKEIPWLVVKGVQDFASPLKNDQYREYAAFVSGVFLKDFIDRYFTKQNM